MTFIITLDEYRELFKTNKIISNLFEYHPDIICLENACNLPGNLKMIKTIVNSGVTPNETCLDIVSKKENNYFYIKFLLENSELKPNNSTLLNTCSKLQNYRTIVYLIEEQGLEPSAECLKILLKTYHAEPALMFMFRKIYPDLFDTSN